MMSPIPPTQCSSNDGNLPVDNRIEKVNAFMNAIILSLKAGNNGAQVFDESIQNIYDSVRDVSLNDIDGVSYTDILALLKPVDAASKNDVKFLESVLTRSKKEKIKDSLSSLIYDQCLDSIDKSYLTIDLLKNPNNLTFNSLLPDLALSAQNYGSAVRTLLVQGVSHLLGFSIAEPKLENLKKPSLFFRAQRMKKAEKHTKLSMLQ
ncbi:hypothetical protein Rin_00012510 [Candidatus Regiella insecticola 5.15]|uniref:Uncharacterized protein n=1 Tax=Candidatus Regiella insecticola 5.15 TaxID=1005043 RepID=G2GZM8_9ENTR|nr:hypothetical protein [Candidatus Regiella insecticola]EGY28785.1 hypothetical protein Rin_00012510 [Candidatus Regiella insecticola 5.15]